MGFLSNIFNSPTPPPAPKPVGTPAPPARVPASLPKIAALTAAPVCRESQPGPPARELLTPQKTPAQFLTALQQRNLTEDSVKFLAYGMPERESVWWAVQCAQKVANPANVPDQTAIHAAERWVKNPSAVNQKVAADAAAKTDFSTPGAWAAQAAAWANPPVGTATVPRVAPPPPPPPPRHAPHAAAGAVMLAIAIKAKKLPAIPAAPAGGLPAPAAPGAVAKAAVPGMAPAGAPVSALPGAAGGPPTMAGAGTAVGAAAVAKVAPGAAAALPAPGAAAPGASAMSAATAPGALASPSVSGMATAGTAAAKAAAMAPAQSAGARLAGPLTPATGASPSGGAASLLGSAGTGVPAGSPPSVNLSATGAQSLAKQELSPEERAAIAPDAAPFLKLGFDIASGAKTLG